MPVVGAAYLLHDEDYRFGTGPLLCRVVRVLRETVYDNEPWWEVEAVVKPPMSPGPAYERQLYVKADRLPVARRRASRGGP